MNGFDQFHRWIAYRRSSSYRNLNCAILLVMTNLNSLYHMGGYEGLANLSMVACISEFASKNIPILNAKLNHPVLGL